MHPTYLVLGVLLLCGIIWVEALIPVRSWVHRPIASNLGRPLVRGAPNADLFTGETAASSGYIIITTASHLDR
jgi:hypothetical protein